MRKFGRLVWDGRRRLHQDASTNVRTEREVQNLVRQGYRFSSAEAYAKAAELVADLPPGRVSRGYLSGLIMNGQGNLLMAAKAKSADPATIHQVGVLLNGAYDHAVTCLNDEIGWDEDVIGFGNDVAVFHAINGDIDDAKHKLGECINLLEEGEFKPGPQQASRALAGGTYTNLGVVHSMNGSLSKALENHDIALQCLHKENDNYQHPEDVLAAILINLSTGLRQDRQYPSGVKHADDALQWAEKIHTAYTFLDLPSRVLEAKRLLSSALLNKAFFIMEQASKGDDIELAHSMASRALSYGDNSSVAGLLLSAYTAPTAANAAQFYSKAFDSDISSTLRGCILWNMEQLGDGDEVKEIMSRMRNLDEGDPSVVSPRECAREHLRQVDIGSHESKPIWIQDQPMLVSGRRMFEFCFPPRPVREQKLESTSYWLAPKEPDSAENIVHYDLCLKSLRSRLDYLWKVTAELEDLKSEGSHNDIQSDSSTPLTTSPTLAYFLTKREDPLPHPLYNRDEGRSEVWTDPRMDAENGYWENDKDFQKQLFRYMEKSDTKFKSNYMASLLDGEGEIDETMDIEDMDPSVFIDTTAKAKILSMKHYFYDIIKEEERLVELAKTLFGPEQANQFCLRNNLGTKISVESSSKPPTAESTETKDNDKSLGNQKPVKDGVKLEK